MLRSDGQECDIALPLEVRAANRGPSQYMNFESVNNCIIMESM